MTIGPSGAASAGVGKATSAPRSGGDGVAAGATSISCRGAKTGASGVFSGVASGLAAGAGSGTSKASDASTISSTTAAAGEASGSAGTFSCANTTTPAVKQITPASKRLCQSDLKRNNSLGRAKDTGCDEGNHRYCNRSPTPVKRVIHSLLWGSSKREKLKSPQTCRSKVSTETPSRAKRDSPKQLGKVEACRLVQMRQRHPTWGARKLQDIYQRVHGKGPSESTTKRILERCGLVKKRHKPVVHHSLVRL